MEPHRRRRTYHTTLLFPITNPNISSRHECSLPQLAFPNDYQTGLCDCCALDHKICLDGLFCGYCAAGYQSEALKTGGTGGKNMDVALSLVLLLADNTIFYAAAGGWPVILSGFGHRLTGLSLFTGLIHRQYVNRKYNIEESFAIGCLKGYCCTPCTTCQIHREMIYRQNAPGGVCTSSELHVHPAQAPQRGPIRRAIQAPM